MTSLECISMAVVYHIHSFFYKNQVILVQAQLFLFFWLFKAQIVLILFLFIFVLTCTAIYLSLDTIVFIFKLTLYYNCFTIRRCVFLLFTHLFTFYLYFLISSFKRVSTKISKKSFQPDCCS